MEEGDAASKTVLISLRLCVLSHRTSGGSEGLMWVVSH